MARCSLVPRVLVPELRKPAAVAPFLARAHYLGPTDRGIAWSDDLGVIVLATPTSRRMPSDGTWLELSRWCLLGERNGGSRQFARVVRWLKRALPAVTTIVSYSDPAAGHTGALYRACNFQWAPTWHRLSPPPTGNGSWREGVASSVKDRWVYGLRPDPRREAMFSTLRSARSIP